MKHLFSTYQNIIDPLHALRNAFLRHGFEIRLVGGCVRDMLSGITPKDVDLCTNATPEEQATIYVAAGIRHIDTGLQHGTYTVVLDGETYEITSLRTETDHDGRHAKVHYTRDWALDLSRRDLSINAMMLDLDGVLLDPYGGQQDLQDHRIVFVGNAIERIHEDYLRVLRWLRFHARFTDAVMRVDLNLDPATVAVVIRQDVRDGLAKISRERVWSEVSRIVTGPHGGDMLRALNNLKLNEAIDLPVRSNEFSEALGNALRHGVSASAVMAAYLGSEETVEALAAVWRWSSAEKIEALVVVRYWGVSLEEAKRAVVLDGVNQSYLVNAMLVGGDPVGAKLLAEWAVPVFGTTGDDLMRQGYRQGRELGQKLKELRLAWVDSELPLPKDHGMSQQTIKANRS